jgi:hypothetical protein
VAPDRASLRAPFAAVAAVQTAARESGDACSKAEGRDQVPKAPSCSTRHTHAHLEMLLRMLRYRAKQQETVKNTNKDPISTVETISRVVVTGRDEEEIPGGRSEGTIIDAPKMSILRESSVHFRQSKDNGNPQICMYRKATGCARSIRPVIASCGRRTRRC